MSHPQMRDLEMRLAKRAGQGFLVLIELPMTDKESDLVLNSVTDQMHSKGAKEGLSYISRFYPWSFIRWLVGESARLYEGGSLWPHLGENLALPTNIVREACGDEFERLCTEKGVRRFNGPLRYVSQIVAHGGVPVSELPELFALVASSLERLPASPTSIEILQTLAGIPDFKNAKKPLQRFLMNKDLTELIHEYLEQLSRVLQHGITQSTPLTLQQAFRLYYANIRTKSIPAAHKRVLVGLDYSADSPVVLSLPEVVTVTSQLPWKVMTEVGELELPSNIPDRTVHGFRHGPLKIPIDTPVNQLVVESLEYQRNVLNVCLDDWAVFFLAEGPLLDRRWLRPNEHYQVILRPNCRLTGANLLHPIPGYFGSWANYDIWEIQTRHEDLLVVGDDTVRAYIPVVAPLTRRFPAGVVTVEGEASCILKYGPAHPQYGNEEEWYLEFRDGRPNALADVRILPDIDEVDVNISDAVGLFGGHQVTLHGPCNFIDDVYVDHRPGVRIDVPHELSWPGDEGHISGTFTVMLPAGYHLEGEAPSLTTTSGVTTYHIHLPVSKTGWDGSVNTPLGRYQGHWPIRQVWWEWLRGPRTVTNVPLLLDWDDLKNGGWEFRWGGPTAELHLKLLDEDGVVIRDLGFINKESQRPILDVREEIRAAAGEHFTLVAAVWADSGPERFTIANIDRPTFRSIVSVLNPDKLTIRWSGSPVNEVRVGVHDILHDVAITYATSKPTQVGPDEWQIHVGCPLTRTPYRLSLSTTVAHHFRCASAEASDRSLAWPQDPYQRQVAAWIEGNSPPNPPMTRDEVAMVVRALPYLKTNSLADAQPIIVGSVIQLADHWLYHLASQRDPTMFEYAGVPQWPMGGLRLNVYHKVLQTLQMVGAVSPSMRWLVISACGGYDISQGVAEQTFGTTGNVICTALSNLLTQDSPSARSALIRIAQSRIPECPSGNGRPAIEVMDRDWLVSTIDPWRRHYPLVEQYARWHVNQDSTSEGLWELSLLQRLLAHEVASSTIERRLIKIYTSLDSSWRRPYRHELLSADLVAALVRFEHMEREISG